jgi:hypothetical protein
MTEDVGAAGAFDSGPSALIFADNGVGACAASEAVHIVGGRVVAQLGIDEAVDRLGRQAAIDTVIVELSADHGPLADRLLDLLSYIAARDNRPVIVSAPFDILDCVAARLHEGPITLLCEPDIIDRVSALAVALGGHAPLGVADVSSDTDNLRLRRLAEEVNRIARTLARLSSDQPTLERPAPQLEVEDVQLSFAAEHAELPTADEVRSILRRRRLRGRFFDPGLFADPAWDMLLDLMAARLEGEDVAVTSLCIAAAVPSTTALRWIRNLTDIGLFHRRADPSDGRRVYISLTDAAARAMSRYLAAAQGQKGLVV